MKQPTENESNSETPETEALRKKHGSKPMQFADLLRFAKDQTLLCEKLERERDEARELCRWAFPRLRAMSHDFDALGISWECTDRIVNNPKVFFTENR